MSYRTIVVHVDESRHAPQRIRLAARLAAEHEAHLVGVAVTGVSREVFPHGYQAAPGTLEASYFQPLHDAAARALEVFGELALGAGVSFEKRLVCDLASEALARIGRFADLVVVGQDDPNEALKDTIGRIPEYVAFTSARPVLVVPCAPVLHGMGRHVLAAWNGGKEAAGALLAALPVMRRAVRVTVAAFLPQGAGELDEPQQQADLAAFLARHEVQAELLVLHRNVDGGRALLDLARRENYDLLVMGCYGHSQFRELFLGGVTRRLLQDATLPLLMAR
ncbi:universal stress protein [Massilia sp. G4R7]|uniref:Universal stress protein n=1 Tax=Massilia phyllostachyos TaxID=2898585 RepID=A0ABS8Q5G0_9BURK|nr:universal stress protein [Massilia phyllostachyos]MCD2516196.1 universal stress protein [Massilia phyllostachyos]